MTPKASITSPAKCSLYQCRDRARYEVVTREAFRGGAPAPKGKGYQRDLCGTHVARRWWEQERLTVISVRRVS